MKALSLRAVSENFEKFQATTSRKGLVSVLAQLPLVLAWPSLLSRCGFVRQVYMDFQEAGDNCGLLHSCGKMCTTEPQLHTFH